MSKYYTINGLKVRVSDHEPNHSMNRFRGQNDIEFYTINIERKPMSVVSQVEWYCEDHDLDIQLFAEVLADFPDAPVYDCTPIKREPIIITQEFLDAFNAIGKRKRISKQEAMCQKYNVAYFPFLRGEYIIK